ncbi:hypothetical protein VNO77_46833 [Canavalia gladiata]|uniref:Uncharacterized protein n=1 Tax=Canavalia gladiata TaxID=3824 RepID=A0AAN9JJB0_CANGL
MDWIKSPDLDIQARIPFSLFQKEKSFAGREEDRSLHLCIPLVYRSEHPVCWTFPGLKKSVPPKMGVSSRLPARQTNKDARTGAPLSTTSI